MPLRRILVATVFGALIMMSTGCSSEAPHPRDTGAFSGTGTLIPVEVSLIRRGTHALAVNGETVLYVESKTRNLRDFEGQTVFVRGTLQPNTAKDALPVLVVDDIRTSLDTTIIHIWEVPAMNLRISAPQQWKGSIDHGIVSFRFADSDTAPFLVIATETVSGSVLPTGSPLYIAGRRAIRISKKTDVMQQVLLLEGDGTAIRFHFDPSASVGIERQEEAQILLVQFERLLSDIRPLRGISETVPTTGTGGINMPCGGSAGILCPTGFFCDITDIPNSVGVCRSR